MDTSSGRVADLLLQRKATNKLLRERRDSISDKPHPQAMAPEEALEVEPEDPGKEARRRLTAARLKTVNG